MFVTRGDETILLSSIQFTCTAIGTQPRLETPLKVMLELVEMRSGGYFGENDIVCLEGNHRCDVRVECRSIR